VCVLDADGRLSDGALDVVLPLFEDRGSAASSCPSGAARPAATGPRARPAERSGGKGAALGSYRKRYYRPVAAEREVRAVAAESGSGAGPPPTAQPSGPPAPAVRSQAAARGGRPVAVRSFVALGDSFSEGVGDPWPDGSSCRGWADRLAEILAEQTPQLRYANLAIRGKTLAQVLDEQVPAAAAMRPDLVTLAAGGNDLLRPRADPDKLAEPFNQAIEQLTAAGSRVLIFLGFNPSLFPLIRMIRGRSAIFNAHLRAIARQHDCLIVDLWAMRVLSDPRMWSVDRLHMSPEGHRRVALRTAEELGVPVEASWREPLPPVERVGGAVPAWLAARRLDAEWARVYAAPWVRRRVTGVSSGDGMTAKRPNLLPL
jgi:lysophospholipase L1-like esterase